MLDINREQISSLIEKFLRNAKKDSDLASFLELNNLPDDLTEVMERLDERGALESLIKERKFSDFFRQVKIDYGEEFAAAFLLKYRSPKTDENLEAFYWGLIHETETDLSRAELRGVVDTANLRIGYYT